MSGLNLPPGVSVSDIPGNRPEDAAEDEFWQAMELAAIERGGQELADAIAEVADTDEGQEALLAVRDFAFARGYDEGQSDAGIEAALAEAERARPADEEV